MTFKDLQKLIQKSQPRTQERNAISRMSSNKPFWIWNIQQHKLEDIRTNGNCCFNHIIGLPQKDGIDKPLYDYEGIIFDKLVTNHGNKHLWTLQISESTISRDLDYLRAQSKVMLCSQMI